MTSLIAQYNSKGCTGRCDAKCYNATTDKCDCICCGVNHGMGKARAMDNTQRMAGQWIEEWQKQHPNDNVLVRRNGKLVQHNQMQMF